MVAKKTSPPIWLHRCWTLLDVADELFPDAFHNTARHTNNRIEIDQRNRAPPLSRVTGRHESQSLRLWRPPRNERNWATAVSR
jgi:hypothetical protein